MPLQFFPNKPHFDFMGKRWYGFAVSIALTLLSLGLVATKGLNLGIDFTGGILMEIHTQEPADLSKMRGALDNQGFGEVSLQNIGGEHEVMIRIQVSEADDQAVLTAKVKELLAAQIGEGIDYRKIDYVGPTVGQELIENGIIAVLLSFLSIMVYVWFRFEWQYGFGAVLALLHDAIMVVGFFALTRFEFGLTAIAAILTIVGYSINDTVVIYDRIRENMRRFKKMPVFELLNLSINETLSRTILTASTTLLAALALALFGGPVIEGFAWAMAFGVAVGTYSSVYISAPTLIYLKLKEEQTQGESKLSLDPLIRMFGALWVLIIPMEAMASLFLSYSLLQTILSVAVLIGAKVYQNYLIRKIGEKYRVTYIDALGRIGSVCLILKPLFWFFLQ
jgi:preprotein translocase SecF subunit